MHSSLLLLVIYIKLIYLCHFSSGHHRQLIRPLRSRYLHSCFPFLTSCLPRYADIALRVRPPACWERYGLRLQLV